MMYACSEKRAWINEKDRNVLIVIIIIKTLWAMFTNSTSIKWEINFEFWKLSSRPKWCPENVFSVFAISTFDPLFIICTISQNYKRLCYRRRVYDVNVDVCMQTAQKGLVINFNGRAGDKEGG